MHGQHAKKKYQSSAYQSMTEILTDFADQRTYAQVVRVCDDVADPDVEGV